MPQKNIQTIIRHDDKYVIVMHCDVNTGVILKHTKMTEDAWNAKIRLSQFNPYTCETLDQLREYCLVNGETQHSHVFNLLNTVGKHYPTLLKLCKHILYRNILFLSKKELSDVFTTTNVIKSLRLLKEANLINYEYLRNHKHFKIQVNPAYFFKGQSMDRMQAIQKWYSSNNIPPIDENEIVENVLGTPLENVIIEDISDYKEPFVMVGMTGYKLENTNPVILWCNDIDFSLVFNQLVDYDDLVEAYEGISQQGDNNYFKSML